MRTHRIVRIVATALLVVALLVFLIGLVLAVRLGTGGVGQGWGLGWRGWAWLPLLLSMLGSALTMVILGAILLFLPKIEHNLVQARENRKMALETKAALKPAKAEAKVEAALPKVEAEVPEVEAEIEGKLPDVGVALPEVEAELPEVKTEVPKVEAEVKAKVEGGLPDVDVALPEVEAELPEVKTEVPKVEAEVKAKVEGGLPDVDVALPEVEAEMPEIKTEVKAKVEGELPEVNVAKPVTVNLSDQVAELQSRLADLEAQGVTIEAEEPGGDLKLSGNLPGAGKAARIAEELNAIRQIARDRRKGEEDDLQIIKGIGPVYSKRLKAKGVRTFADLAETSEELLEELTEGNLERVIRDNWRGQARMLSL